MSARAGILLALCLLSTAAAQQRERSVTLQQAVESAVFHHPDVLEIAADREMALIEVRRRVAAFTPTIRMGVDATKARLLTQFGERSTRGIYEQTQFNGSVALGGRGPLGGEYELKFETYYLDDQSDRDWLRLNPLMQTQLGLTLRQPLLRGAGPLGGWVQIDQARLASRVAEEDLRTRLQTVIGTVVESYWQLARRIEELKILRTNISEAEKLRETVQLRIKSGTLSPVALAQADATYAARRKDVEGAMLEVIEAERQLLAASFLTSSGEFRWDEQLIPVDDPGEEAISTNVDEQLKLAMERRPEIARTQRAIELARQQLAIAQNDSRFRLDAIVGGGLAGLGGTNVVRPSSIGQPIPGSVTRGGAIGAFGTLLSGDGPYAMVGLEGELPLNNDDLGGAAEQAAFELRKAEAQGRRALVNLELELRAAMQQVMVATERLRVVRESERLAGLNVDAERRKFQAGESTTFDVLRTQDDLARARAETIGARLSRATTIARFEAVRGTLMERFGLRFEQVVAPTGERK